MILPIVAYGHPVLRKIAEPINSDYPGLEKLVADMWETMYASNGVGLAAPQINRNIRLFVVDTEQMFRGMDEKEKAEFPGDEGLKAVFINARIEELEGEEWAYNEGCLSIPKIREDIYRQESVTITFEDENFETHTRTFTGLTARVILHEYDHIEGILFIDRMKPLKRRMINRKLEKIKKGEVDVDHPMRFVKA